MFTTMGGCVKLDGSQRQRSSVNSSCAILGSMWSGYQEMRSRTVSGVTCDGGRGHSEGKLGERC